MSRSPRSVVVVSEDSLRAELLAALMADTNDYDVFFVESIARAYSRIKKVNPELVVLYLEIDDLAGCQLLSMINMDGDVSGIPVMTVAAPHDRSTLTDVVSDVSRRSPRHVIGLQMN